MSRWLCPFPFHVTAFPGTGSCSGLPKAPSSSSTPQLWGSFSVQSILSWTLHGRSCIQNPCGDIPRGVHCSNPTASPKGQTLVLLQDLIPSGSCFLLVYKKCLERCVLILSSKILWSLVRQEFPDFLYIYINLGGSRGWFQVGVEYKEGEELFLKDRTGICCPLQGQSAHRT